MYTLKGTIKVISDTQQISDSFKKREFVVTDSSGQYPQHIQLQLVQDRTSNLDGFAVGDEIEVGFFLRGREWTSPKDGTVRYFNSLDAYKIEKVGAAAPAAPAGPPEGPPPPTAANPADLSSSDDDDDDLPF